MNRKNTLATFSSKFPSTSPMPDPVTKFGEVRRPATGPLPAPPQDIQDWLTSGAVRLHTKEEYRLPGANVQTLPPPIEKYFFGQISLEQLIILLDNSPDNPGALQQAVHNFRSSKRARIDVPPIPRQPVTQPPRARCHGRSKVILLTLANTDPQAIFWPLMMVPALRELPVAPDCLDALPSGTISLWWITLPGGASLRHLSMLVWFATTSLTSAFTWTRTSEWILRGL